MKSKAFEANHLVKKREPAKDTVFLIAKKGNDWDTETVDNAIQAITLLDDRQLADKHIKLRIPSSEGFRFQRGQFVAQGTEGSREMSSEESNFKLSENLFSYGTKESEREPKEFSLPMGYLNIHITLANGDKRSDIRTNLAGQVRYLNQQSLQVLSPDTTSFAEVIREGKKVSNAIFLSRFFLLRVKPSSCRQVGEQKTKMLSLLGAMRDQSVLSVNLDDYETGSEETNGQQKKPSANAVKELVYSFQLPDLKVEINPFQSQPHSVSRMKYVFYELHRHLVAINDNLIVVKNALAETKRVPERFAYFMTPKCSVASKGGNVVLHEKITDDVCVFDPKLFSHKVLAGFEDQNPTLDGLFRALDSLFYTYGYTLHREKFGIQQKNIIAIPRSQQKTGADKYFSRPANDGEQRKRR